MADKDWRSGQGQEHNAHTRRTYSGHMADKSQQDKPNTTRTRIEDTAQAKNTRRTHRGHLTDTRRTSGGQGLKARPKPTTQGGHKVDKWRTSGGQAADKWRTRTGGAAKANNTRRGHYRQTSGGQGLAAQPEPTTQGTKAADRTSGGQAVGKWWASGGQGLEARPKQTTQDKWRTQAGHMADKLRGRGQSISRPAFFFLRENPTVDCLGNNYTSIGPKQFFKGALAKAEFGSQNECR